MAIWPSILPQYLEVGAQSDPVESFSRFQPSQGPALQRPRYSGAVPKEINGQIHLTDYQMAKFEEFYFITLIGGGLPFDFPRLSDRQIVQHRFTRRFRSVALSGEENGVKLWQVSLNLEELP